MSDLNEETTPQTAKPRRGRPPGSLASAPRKGTATERIVDFIDAHPGLTLEQVVDQSGEKRQMVKDAIKRWRPAYFHQDIEAQT